MRDHHFTVVILVFASILLPILSIWPMVTMLVLEMGEKCTETAGLVIG